MRYWVQYHNFEKIQSFPEGYGISTNKPEVLDTIGDTIFLIMGISEPRQYLLWSRFVCTDVEDGYPPPWQYVAYGDGWTLEYRRKQKGILLNLNTHFADYLRYCQNFKIGFHEVTNHPFCQILIELSEQHRTQPLSTSFKKNIDKTSPNKPTKISATIPNTNRSLEKIDISRSNDSNDVGAGFGNPDSNKAVEIAAIKAITNYYEEQGCKVNSVESQNLGYDLLCKAKNGIELHIEVKGIAGKGKQFIITSNEFTEAQNYPSIYRLAIVNMATSAKPIFTIYTGEEFLQQFNFKILNYMASLK